MEIINRAELAVALTAAGYSNVRNYADGIADWAAADFPLESGSATDGATGAEQPHRSKPGTE